MKKYIIAAALIVTAGLLAHHAVAAKGGTSILHWTVVKTFTGADGLAGKVEVSHKEQGGASKQTLKLKLTGLTDGTEYFLIAVSDDDDTNSVALPAVQNGVVRVAYMKKSQGKGTPRYRLPEELDPVIGLRSLAISNATDVILTADLTTPDHAQYLIKRSLTPTLGSDADGTLRIKSNGHHDRLRIVASDLEKDSTYHLELNGVIEGSYTSSPTGKLTIKHYPLNAPSVLTITNLALLNGESNAVLSTTLP